MPPSSPLRDRISVYRGVVTVAFLLAIGGIVLLSDRQIPPALALLSVMTFVYLLSSTVNAVRAHSLYHLGSSVYTALLFGIAYIATGSETTFLLALMGLSALEVAVEAYNYLYGTSHLRLDLSGVRTRSR